MSDSCSVLHHGPLCPKRIADQALSMCAGAVFSDGDDLGFADRKLAENTGLVEAVAEAIGKLSSVRWTSWGIPAPDEVQLRETMREEAIIALRAVDDFKRGGT